MKASGSTTSNTIAVILAIGVLVLAWKMVLPAYFSHKTTLKNLTSEVEAAKVQLESIEKSKAELNAIKPITDQLLVAVPKGVDEPDLISELEAIAIKNSIVLPAISIATTLEAGTSGATNTTAPTDSTGTTADTGTSAVPSATGETAASKTSGSPITISLSVTGSFENLNSFIAGLEKSVRFMNITGLTYSVDAEAGDNSLALQIEAYQR